MPGDIDFKQVALLSLFGLCMMWSPIFGTTEAIVFPAAAGFPDELLASRVANLAAFGLVMAFISIAGEGARRLLSRTGFVAAIVALGCAGMIVGSLAAMGAVPIWWLYPGAVARGAFYGVITVLWIDVLVRQKGSIIGVCVAAALALYSVIGLAIVGAAQLAPVLAMALLALCPFLSCIGCVRAASVAEAGQPVDGEGAATPKRTRVLFYGANFLFGCMLGAVLCHFAFSDTPVAMAAFLAMSVIMAAVFASPAGNLGLHAVFRAIIMCFAVVVPLVILLGLLDVGTASLMASAALVIIMLYTVVIFADTQARMRNPYWKVPGMTQFFAALGMILSCVAVRFVYPDGNMPDSHLVLLTASCLMFIASVFSPSVHSKVRPWGFSSLVPEESSELKALRRCGELADAHKLTSRELEILQQLAAGMTRDEIAATFVISPATVKTHIRNIYAKLDIHSQKELIALIEQ